MRRYLFGILTGTVLTPIVLYNIALLLPNKNLEAARWTNECLTIKADIAKHTQKPQILILSGSNALFGFSSAEITQRYGFPSTNLAVHGGLGRKYILTYGEKLAKKGDLLVLPLEYEQYEKEPYGAAYYNQILANDRDYFQSLSLEEKLRVLANISFADYIRFAKNIIRPDTKAITGYNSRTLNSFGDETENKKSKVDSAKLENLKHTAAKKYEFDDNSIADLSKLKTKLSEIGANVVLAYPNILENALDEKINESFFLSIKELSRKTGVKIVGTPSEGVFGLDDAYDTIYHQNNLGQMKSTHRLMRQLIAAKVPLPD